MSEQQRGEASISRHWKAHVKALAGSGLSRAEYCRRHDLSYHALTYWQRKLNRSDHPLPVLVQVPVHPSNDRGMVPGKGSGIIIRLDDRVAIELSEQFSAATLGRVLTVLEAR